MLRAIVMAALVYAYGHPIFEGYRPPGLDRPLKAFYVEANKAALTGRQALARNGDWVLGYLKTHIDNVEAQLRSSS